jgi:methylated-DNA-protein-cysteine methyltransferase-like protein
MPDSPATRGIGRGDVTTRGATLLPLQAVCKLCFTGRGAYAATVSTERTQRIIERVRSTPEGFVRTYGDVSPGAPRAAGAALHECHDASVPWHRIVRGDGSLAKGEAQRRLLEAEGVPFRGERVNMRAARLFDH